MFQTMRVAILNVDTRLLRDKTLAMETGRFEGDVWIEPERRYEIGALLREADLPQSWHLAQFDHRPAIWYEYYSGYLCIVIESEDFPEVPEGQMIPKLDIILRQEFDEVTGKRTIHLVTYSLR